MEPNLSKKFHNIQVELYAEYDRPKLLNFLRNSLYVVLNHALKIAQERNLIPEMIYILEKMGQFEKALKLILYYNKDINGAIEFCKRNNEKDLWEDLIKFSLDKPNYVIELLNNNGTNIEPINLINRLDKDIKIKDLRETIDKILQNYRVKLNLLEGSEKIISGNSNLK